MRIPIRSLTEPPGFSISTLARTVGSQASGHRVEAHERRVAHRVQERVEHLHRDRAPFAACGRGLSCHARTGPSRRHRVRGACGNEQIATRTGFTFGTKVPIRDPSDSRGDAWGRVTEQMDRGRCGCERSRRIERGVRPPTPGVARACSSSTTIRSSRGCSRSSCGPPATTCAWPPTASLALECRPGALSRPRARRRDDAEHGRVRADPAPAAGPPHRDRSRSSC